MQPDISVVVPVYNAAPTLHLLISRTIQTLENMRLSNEIVLVDDGSHDNSWEQIKQANHTYGNKIRGFKLTHNRGQQAATFCGLLHARGQWVITIDDDLQTPPEEITKLWSEAQRSNADVVYGTHDIPRHDFFHRMGTKLFRALLRKIAPGFPDGSSFRLINRDIIKLQAPGAITPGNYLDPVLAWFTSDMVSVKVQHQKRQNGRSGYSTMKLIKLALKVLVVHSTLPLTFIIGFGFCASIVSALLGSFFLLQKLLIGAQLGFSAIIVTITFLFSIVLLSLGVLGLYVSRTYTIDSGQPPFVVKHKVE